MSIRQSIRSIEQDYLALINSAYSGTTSLAGERVSEQRYISKKPPGFGDEAAEIEKLLTRVARIVAARRKAAGAERFDTPTDHHHPAKQAAKRSILEERGRSAAELAYLYGKHQTAVERIRREAGQDPVTGERRDALTAPVGRMLRVMKGGGANAKV